jgi:hypothetical protein
MGRNMHRVYAVFALAVPARSRLDANLMPRPARDLLSTTPVENVNREHIGQRPAIRVELPSCPPATLHEREDSEPQFIWQRRRGGWAAECVPEQAESLSIRGWEGPMQHGYPASDVRHGRVQLS